MSYEEDLPLFVIKAAWLLDAKGSEWVFGIAAVFCPVLGRNKIGLLFIISSFAVSGTFVYCELKVYYHLKEYTQF